MPGLLAGNSTDNQGCIFSIPAGLLAVHCDICLFDLPTDRTHELYELSKWDSFSKTCYLTLRY